MLNIFNKYYSSKYNTLKLSKRYNKYTYYFYWAFISLIIHDLSYYLANEINLKKPDLVVLGGDLITGKDINHNGHNNWNKNIYNEQWDKFLLFRDKLNSPLLAIPGNHDFGGNPETNLLSIANFKSLNNESELYFKKIINKTLLLFVHAIDQPNDPIYRIDTEQLNWIKSTLNKHQPFLDNIIIFVHHRLWDMDSWNVNRPLNTVQFSTEIEPLLSKWNTSNLFAGDLGLFHNSQLSGTTNCWNASNMLTKSGYFTIDIKSVSDIDHINIQLHYIDIGQEKPKSLLTILYQKFTSRRY
ncbi:metallophosphoesterase, partial [Flavobacteriaceae bacterium]|nr:metallophosphoesterase [Flavobacteriaceae bacterium]